MRVTKKGLESPMCRRGEQVRLPPTKVAAAVAASRRSRTPGTESAGDLRGRAVGGSWHLPLRRNRRSPLSGRGPGTMSSVRVRPLPYREVHLEAQDVEQQDQLLDRLRVVGRIEQSVELGG